jgi:hypothetical protein
MNALVSLLGLLLLILLLPILWGLGEMYFDWVLDLFDDWKNKREEKKK